METLSVLRRQFDARRCYLPFRALPAIEDEGLLLGRGTVLTRMAVTRSGNPDQASNEPQVCPAAVKDTPHGAKDRAHDYEDDVHLRVNPLAPIPREFAVMLMNQITGRPVFFDDCFRYAGDLIAGDMQKGDLVEAKGTGYEWRLRADGKIRADPLAELKTQAVKELSVAQASGRGLKWYFAEKFAADFVRDYFVQKFQSR